MRPIFRYRHRPSYAFSPSHVNGARISPRVRSSYVCLILPSSVGCRSTWDVWVSDYHQHKAFRESRVGILKFDLTHMWSLSQLSSGTSCLLQISLFRCFSGEFRFLSLKAIPDLGTESHHFAYWIITQEFSELRRKVSGAPALFGWGPLETKIEIQFLRFS